MNQPTPASSPEYVSAEKLSTLFDPPLSIGFIRNLQSARVIPFVRLGRRVLFHPPSVFAVLEKKNTVHARGTEAA